MLSSSIWFYAPSFWIGGGLESRCVGRVYGVDGAVQVTRHHPHRRYDLHSGSQDPDPTCNLHHVLVLSFILLIYKMAYCGIIIMC